MNVYARILSAGALPVLCIVSYAVQPNPELIIAGLVTGSFLWIMSGLER